MRVAEARDVNVAAASDAAVRAVVVDAQAEGRVACAYASDGLERLGREARE